MKKFASALILLLLLFVFMVVLPQIEVVKADDTIYIRADGSIEGTDKIQREGNIYTFTGNISGKIAVQKSFIRIEGVGYTLQGGVAYLDRGIDLSNNRGADSSRPKIVNVTIKDLRIVNFTTGIYYAWTSNDTILGNYIAECGSGIDVIGGQNNVLIKLNTFENNDNDITINYSSGGTQIITQNNIENDFIQVWMSEQPIIDMNYWAAYNGTDNNGDGIGDSPYYYHDILMDSHPLMDPVPVIPEFPLWIILPLLIVATLVVTIARNKLVKRDVE